MNLQENFYDTYQQLTENLTIAIECLPMCFYYDYEKIKYYENSKRVLLPKYILHQLSKYENIEFPINIKVTNETYSISKYVTVLEFIPDIEHMYLSNHMFSSLQLSETDVVSFEVLKDALPTATSIKIKPHTNNFALIENKKSYLEANFKNLFGIIEKGDIVDKIINQAGEDKIIVMGASKMNPLKRYFKGSIPLSVMNRCNVPILIVK